MSVQFTLTERPDLDDPCFHNAGARDLLALLGYVPDAEEYADMGGAEDAVLFTGRALLAVALVDVASADEEGSPGFWEGATFHGGRSAGYLAERLEMLVELGMRAQEVGSQVVWG